MNGLSAIEFPTCSTALENFGIKFSDGGAHISRTMMLAELEAVLRAVPIGSDAADYKSAILTDNVLGKTTSSTRDKSLRHLRELYALDEAVGVFGALRLLHQIDSNSLPLLALQVAWARDPLLRATTAAVLSALEGERVDKSELMYALQATFGHQYSELNRDKVARNAASSWTQSGHLTGRAKKTRRRASPTVTDITMALFLGDISGYKGPAVFSNPWCRLLDLDASRARTVGFAAHRAGLVNLRAIDDVVEISFPLLVAFQPESL